GSLERLYDIGTVLNVDGQLGIVVGYCGVGYEYVLFENKQRDDGYSVRGIEHLPRKRVKKIDPLEVLHLFVMMNDYLTRNQFNLSTAHQKVCYQHWRRTGEYEFKNPISDIEEEKLKIEDEIKLKLEEVESLKNKLYQIR